MSPEDELDNLQQLLNIQPAATTTPSSSGASDSSDPFVVSMIQKIMFNFTYDKCVYICLISWMIGFYYLILYKISKLCFF